MTREQILRLRELEARTVTSLSSVELAELIELLELEVSTYFTLS